VKYTNGTRPPTELAPAKLPMLALVKAVLVPSITGSARITPNTKLRATPNMPTIIGVMFFTSKFVKPHFTSLNYRNLDLLAPAFGMILIGKITISQCCENLQG